VTEANVYQQLAQNCYLTVKQSGFNPTKCLTTNITLQPFQCNGWVLILSSSYTTYADRRTSQHYYST